MLLNSFYLAEQIQTHRGSRAVTRLLCDEGRLCFDFHPDTKPMKPKLLTLLKVRRDETSMVGPPTSGHVQAGVEMRRLLVFAAELSAELLKRGLSLPENRLQAADPLHVLLGQGRLTRTNIRAKRIKNQELLPDAASYMVTACVCMCVFTILSRSLWTLLFSMWIFS